MRLIRRGQVGATRRRLILLKGLYIVSPGRIVRCDRQNAIVAVILVSQNIRAYPSRPWRNHVGNPRSGSRPVWPAIAIGPGVGWASAEIADTASLEAAGCAERSAASIAGRACKSTRNGSAEAPVKR